MRNHLICLCAIVLFACLGLAQQTVPKIAPANAAKSSDASVDPKLRDLLESNVRAEWEALKKKDTKAYGELLAEDYEGVEVDGQGERTRTQAMNEVVNGNVYDYTFWGFKVISATPDMAFVVFEITMKFPPKSVVHFSRVYIGELWVKRNGEWKELHYQETHIK